MDEIKPAFYYEKDGIPVFKPNEDQFKDFNLFVKSVLSYGKKSGIIKIIPPKSWKNSNQNINSKLSNLEVKKPTKQHFLGSQGVFEQLNIPSRKSYTLEDFYSLTKSRDYRAPQNNPGGRTKQTDSELDLDPYKKSKFYSQETLQLYERKYWSNIAYIPPLYGADSLGSLFESELKVWNLNNLDDLLKKIDVQLPGVNAPYLYFGMWRATFSWHTEDMDLFSINYIHRGAPKQWYAIPTSYNTQFENLMNRLFSKNYSQCKEFLRHKTFLVSPKILGNNGIPVQRVVQFEEEFIITFPGGYHAGYNIDFNVAESVNFATDYWIPIGREAKICKCTSDSVVIHMCHFDAQDNNNFIKRKKIKIEDIVNNKKSNGNKIEKRKSLKDATNINKNFKNISNGYIEESTGDKFNCLLCYKKTGDQLLKSFRRDTYAHRICSKSTPGISFVFNKKLNSECLIGLNEVVKRKEHIQPCFICKSDQGVPISCFDVNCNNFFHITCISRSRLNLNVDDNVKCCLKGPLINGENIGSV